MGEVYLAQDTKLDRKVALELDPNHIGSQNWLCHTLNAKGLLKRLWWVRKQR